MGLKGNFEVIGGLLDERRETEKEERLLQDQIEHLRAQRDAAAEENAVQNADLLQSLDDQIEELTREMTEQRKRRKDICKIARTVTAGD